MGYQKISEETEKRIREFLESLNRKPQKRGRPDPYYRGAVTFDEAIRMLLEKAGF